MNEPGWWDGVLAKNAAESGQTLEDFFNNPGADQAQTQSFATALAEQSFEIRLLPLLKPKKKQI